MAEVRAEGRGTTTKLSDKNQAPYNDLARTRQNTEVTQEEPSYNYFAEDAEEENADDGVSNFVSCFQGLSPNESPTILPQRSRQDSATLLPLDPPVEVDFLKFKKMIMSQKYKAQAIPAVVLFTGLPDSMKSQSLEKIFNQYLRNRQRTRHFTPNEPIRYRCVLGADLSNGKGWYWLEMDNDMKYNFTFLCALSSHDRYELAKIPDQPPTFFLNEVLDAHLRKSYTDLCSHNYLNASSESKAWRASIPHGLCLMNIWDQGFSKPAQHFIRAIYGLLDRSFPCLFLDLNRDADKVTEIPDLSRFDDHPDNKVIMQWRPRLYYLLRQALAAHSEKRDRKKVCLIVAAHDSNGSDLERKMKEVQEAVNLAVHQVGVADLVEPKVVQLDIDDRDSISNFKRKLESVISKEKPVSLDLAWLFLRSAHYNKGLFIETEELRSCAKELNITEDGFQEFLSTFTSIGSLLYLKQLSRYVILKPLDFLKLYNQLYNPPEEYSAITRDGIVSWTVLVAIFDENASFIIEVLTSLNLAIKLNSNQLQSPPNENEECYYYLPYISTRPPLKECSPQSVHFFYEHGATPANVQLSFTKALFECCPQNWLTAKLLSSKHVNVTCFSVKNQLSCSTLEFDLVHHGDVMEIKLKNEVNEGSLKEVFHRHIVRTCLMIVSGKGKYAFAIRCIKDTEESELSNKPYILHYLPNDKLCPSCIQRNVLSEHLKCWNKVVKEERVSVEHRLHGATVSLDDMRFLATKIPQDKLAPLAVILGVNKKYIEERKGNLEHEKLVLAVLLEWEQLHMKGERNQPARTRLCEALFKLGFVNLSKRLDITYLTK